MQGLSCAGVDNVLGKDFGCGDLHILPLHYPFWCTWDPTVLTVSQLKLKQLFLGKCDFNRGDGKMKSVS